MQEFKTFRLTGSSNHQNPSYLIMILDGTGSMEDEYDLMIKAYKTVFREIIDSNRVHAIQFGSQRVSFFYQNIISDIEPYLRGAGGDFNLAFENILKKLDEDIKADITICVVSDGHERSDLAALQQQIDDVKKKYQIQFTSIAVGSGYPFDLFQEFRNCFHNGPVSCTNVQFVERSYITGEQECLTNFINAFQVVRSQLSQKRKVKVNEQVYESITGQPSYYAQEDSVVASKSNTLTTIEGQKFKETRQASDIAEFIQTSCQEYVKNQSLEKYKDSIQQAKELKDIAVELYKRVDPVFEIKDNNFDGIQQIEKDLFILEQIGKGKIELKNLIDQDKTKLLCLFNPKNAQIQKCKMEELTYLFNQIAEVPSNLMIIKTLSNEKFKDSLQQAKEMEYIAFSLLNKIDLSQAKYQENYQKIKQYQKDLTILDLLSMEKQNFKNLSDQDINNMLSDFNPRDTQIQDPRLVELTAEQLQDKLIQIINLKKEVYSDLINLKTIQNDKFNEVIWQAKEMSVKAKDLLNRIDQCSLENIKMVNFNKFIQQSEKDLYILDKIRIGELDLKEDNTYHLWSDLNPQLCRGDIIQTQKEGLDFRNLCDEQKTKLLWGKLNLEQYQYIGEDIQYSEQNIEQNCQEFLKSQSNEKCKDSIEQAVKQVEEDIYKRVDQSSSQHKENINKGLQQIEEYHVILEKRSICTLDLTYLSEADKTKLLSDFNPQKAELQEAKIQEAKLVELTEEQKQEKFQQKLVELLNEKSENKDHLIIISLMADLIDEAIEEKKSQKDILESFLHPKNKSLRMLSQFTQRHKTWVEQFIECYLNIYN